MNKLLLAVAMLGLPLVAQEHTQHSPYAGETEREIKALSPDDVAGYLAGEGMGFAMAAELNQYPGPKHVLELAEELDLTAEQSAAVTATFEDMQAKAIELGTQLVELERQLDAAFGDRSIDPEQLHSLVIESGRVRAELRYAHLVAHLATTELLTAAQVHQYDMHRGYASHGDHQGHHENP